MLPLIQQEVVSHQWMTLEQLVNFIAVSESTPGPLAVNLSTYVGAETGGLLGALCATFGVVLPSFVIILVVAKFYQAFMSNTVVKGCMNGLRPTVVGMIGASLLSVAAPPSRLREVFFSGGWRGCCWRPSSSPTGKSPPHPADCRLGRGGHCRRICWAAAGGVKRPREDVGSAGILKRKKEGLSQGGWPFFLPCPFTGLSPRRQLQFAAP